MTSLPLRLLAREWRLSEVRLLIVAITLAVASLTSVSFFADRISATLLQNANALLAADLVLRADHAIDPSFEAEAHRLGLASARSQTFLSMVRTQEQPALAGIKAISPGYPLRGQLRVASQAYGPDQPTEALPDPGQAWVDARLASELAVRVGEVLAVGETQLKISAILSHESERNGNFMAMAPRLLMHEADLPNTGLIQEGSRITWRLMLAGEPGQVERFRAWATPRLARGEQLQGLLDARPELREMLDRTQRFLGLAALLAVVLAAAAARMILRRYVERHFDQFALLRCFGSSRRRLITLYLTQFSLLGLLAGSLGSLLGFATQHLLAELLADTLQLELVAPAWWPLWMGLLTGLGLVLAFSLPHMLKLADIPALRVLRRDLGPTRAPHALAHGLGLLVLAGLLLWLAGDLRLALIVLSGSVAAALLAGLIIRAVLHMLPWLERRLPPGPRLGLSGLRRRQQESALQAMALSLGLLALLLLTQVRDDLFASWRGQIPADAPNRFVINIQPEQVGSIQLLLKRHGLHGVQLFPMVQGRLVAINGQTLVPENFSDARARRLIEREFNLSTLAALPPDNELIAGRWWHDRETGVLSVEQGLAETLGIRLNDQLSFDAGGLPFTGRVISLRKVDWDSFRVNFFVVAPEGDLDGMPASHITSFYWPAGHGSLLAELVRAHPNVTVIDVDRVVTEMRTLINRTSQAVQVVFLFSLATGLLVMMSALIARRDERAREIGLWRTLGASASTVRAALATEFACLGLISGAIAAGAASTLAWLLADRVFQLPHQPDPLIWLWGLGGGLVLVVSVGLLATRSLLDAPPIKALRAGQQ